MKLANRFLSSFGSLIYCVLSCFDRVVFKGYLPFHNEGYLNSWVDYTLRLRRTDFIKQLDQKSQKLVDHAKALAEKAGRPYEYRQGWFRKERFIQDVARRDDVSEGLIAVLCVQETWFPYTVQVYVNGHDWLARQMAKRGLTFTQHDNCFTKLEDPVKAQRLADRFAQLNWIKQLNRWVRHVNPHVRKGGWLHDKEYYWVTEQAEFASDVVFRDRAALKGLYPRLIDHAVVNFSAKDILGFLGRKLHGNFLGEVLTDCKKKRDPGVRVKHRMKENWLKMYDKFGLVLRVETVINNPREFKVRRTRTRNGKPTKVWVPMNKGVTNLASYQSRCRAANDRYLNALSVVNDPTPSYRSVSQLTESKVHQGRRYAGFNPARGEDVKFFQAVLSGDHELRGFHNSDVRNQIYGPIGHADVRRRRANAVTRQLKRLHIRGLIAKIPRTRRWRLTKRGRSVIGSIVRLHYHGLSQVA